MTGARLIAGDGSLILGRLEGTVLHRLAPFLLALALGVLAGCGGGGKSATPTETPVGPALPTVEGVPTTTSSGLQIIDITVGSGAEALAGSIVYVTYNEWLSDGRFIDTTTVDGTVTPLRQVLRQGQLLPGLVEGIPGMKVGGTRRLIIPPELGFGAEGRGNAIPADATLIYDIELVEVRAP